MRAHCPVCWIMVDNKSENKNALCKLKNVFVYEDDFVENNYFDDDDPDDNSVSGTSIWFLFVFIFYNCLFMYFFKCIIISMLVSIYLFVNN